jgi:RHS repeat-associated protein
MAVDDATGAVEREYFAEGEWNASGQHLFYGPDGLGSIRDAYVAGIGAVQAYDYAPYGYPLQTPTTGPLAQFRFAGMFYEPNTGLYLTRTRAYSPTLGRWLSRDPIGEAADPAANLYRYVSGNPISLTDPSGRIGVVGAAIGLVAGGVAGYEVGGWWGAATGGVAGAAVGAVAPWLSAEAGTVIAGLTGSTTAGAIASGVTLSAIGAAGGTVADVATNWLEGQPASNNAGTAALIGFAAPLLSGEAALIGLSEQTAAAYGLEGALDWLTAQTGVFAVLGATVDAGVDQLGIFSPTSSPVGDFPSCQE